MGRSGYILLFILFFTGKNLLAQQRELDSLLKVNAVYLKEDSVKLEMLCMITVLYRNTEPNTGVTYGKQAIALANKINSKKGLARANYMLGVDYAALYSNDIALDHYLKAAKIYSSVNETEALSKVYNVIGSLYLSMPNHYADALRYLKYAIEINRKAGNNKLLAFPLSNIGLVYKSMDSTVQALKHLKEALRLGEQYSPENKNLLGTIYSGLAGAYIEAENGVLESIGFSGSRYDTAIFYINKGLKLNEESGDELGITVNYNRLAEVYRVQKKYNMALKYLLESKKMAGKNGFVGVESDAAYLISKIYADLGQYENAYKYQAEYAILTDSVLNDDKEKSLVQKELRYNFEKKEDSLSFQNKLLNQSVSLGKLRLKQQWLISIGGVLVIICFGVLVFYRGRVKQARLELALGKERAEQKQREAEFERKMSDAALNSLRSQMNPHFIFNCLNSIKLYAIENNSEAASAYLGKFSGLMRLVLENSKSELITLQKEIDTLRLYMEMETMRFKHKLYFEINVADDVDKDYIELPPMLIQPYAENAIWHGLMPKEEGGKVIIEFSNFDNNHLQVVVTDSGIGRKKSEALKSLSAAGHKSFGMSITSQRIELINQMYNTEMAVTVTDNYDEEDIATGTTVSLIIPVN